MGDPPPKGKSLFLQDQLLEPHVWTLVGSSTGRSCTEQLSLRKSMEPHQTKPQKPWERAQAGLGTHGKSRSSFSRALKR